MNTDYMLPDPDDDWRPARIRSVELSRVRDELLRLYVPPLRSPKTAAMMRRIFTLLEELGVTQSSQLDEDLVAKLITTRPPGLSCRTVAQLLRSLRIVGNFCKRRGYIRESPFAWRPVGDWVRITPVENRRYYTSEEVRAIMAAMEADVTNSTGWEQWKARRLWAVSACLAYGGFRMSEAFRLHVEDVDLELGIITVVPRVRLKTSAAARLVPSPPRLKEILEKEWIPFRQTAPPGFLDGVALDCPYLFPGVYRQGFWNGGPPAQRPLTRLKIVALRAGVKDANFKRFRHAWACQAEYLGIPGAGIQRVLGHTTELTSLRNYRHAIAKNLTDTVKGFDY
jgi:integrase